VYPYRTGLKLWSRGAEKFEKGESVVFSRLSAVFAGRTRHHKLFTLLGAASAFLLIMFQNFQLVPLEKLKPDYAYARAVSPTDGTGDIRKLAPARPAQQDQSMIAAPQAGTDLGSISQDWAARQAHLITGGAEERMIADFNKKMNRFFKFEDVEGEPYPDSGYDSHDSSEDEGSGASGGGGGRRPASDDEAASGFQPKSMQLVAMNRVQLALKNRTKVSCSVQGGGLRWDVSRPINDRLDVNFRHDSADARSTLNLNYSW